MCGRYVLRHTMAEIQQRFAVQQVSLDFAPRYNVAPTQQMPVIVQHGADRVLETMKWGLVPSWSKDQKPAFATINARAEGITEKPAYRVPIRRQRCLIPADGFYEWSECDGAKAPYFIHFRDDQLFAFAGLYDIFHAPHGEILRTFTIITAAPNDSLAPYHHRMAVILPEGEEDEWLDPGVTDPFQVTRLLKPHPTPDLEVYQVAKLVNRAGYDAPELISPLAPI